MKTRIPFKFIYLIIFLAHVSSCQQQQKPINLTIAKQQVQAYYESGEYEKDLEDIIARAIEYFKHVPATNNATVIFDIDDTVLTAYEDEKAISFGYIPKLSHKWILEADAKAIPQTKRLYDYLVSRGFKIVFLTGRKYNEYDATIKNLKLRSFVTFDKLIVRQPHEVKMTAKAHKSARRKQLSQEGYRIVGAIGDQTSDLEGGHSGHMIKLPNYRYMIP